MGARVGVDVAGGSVAIAGHREGFLPAAVTPTPLH